MRERKVDRREFIRMGTATVVGGAGMLAARSGGQVPAANSVGGVKLPTYAPTTVVKPAYPAGPNGLPEAYLSYPASPPKAWKGGPPAHGGTITVLKEIDGAPPTPLGQNQWWQELNKQVGAQIKTTNVAESDYPTKLQTQLAGGDLPDLIQMSLSTPNLPQVLSHEFQNLSEWLSGDSIKKYPFLAALPTQSWRNVVFNGGIWGIPWPLGVIGADLKARQDIFQELGLSTEVSDGTALLDLLKSLTDTKKQRWALDQINSAIRIVSEMMGVPNGWKVKNGKFTSAYTTEEYKSMLSEVTKIWKLGYIYPNSLASTTAFHQWFQSGTVAMIYDGYTNWSELMAQGVAVNPNFRIEGVITGKWKGGGQAAHYEGNGIYTFMALRKTNKSRAKELLKVLDWFAAPFGSQEYLFNSFGIANHDYTLQGTDPVETPTGVNEVANMNIHYLAISPRPLYIPGHPDVTKGEYAYYKKLTKVVVPSPTVGLYSPTNSTTGASITKTLTSVAQDIIVGRQPLSAWDPAVQTWRSGGGDKIAQEYEKALEASHKSHKS